MAALREYLGDSAFPDACRLLTEGPSSPKLRVRESKLHSELYLVQYFHGSDMDNPLSREARGIVLRKNTNEVVAYPFDKFWNYNEARADQLDWATACVQEKIDGSLIKVYWWRDQWIVGTNNTIDAREASSGAGDYRKLFNEAAPDFPFAQLDPGLTYCFELVHPKIASVVRYTEARLYHLGTRRIADFKELHVDVPGIAKPRAYPLTSLSDAVAAAAALTDPHQDEGFVVCDAAFRRVKVKTPMYVALRVSGGNRATPSFLLETLLSHEEEEVLAYYPQHAQQYGELKAAFESLVAELREAAAPLKGWETRAQVGQLGNRYPRVKNLLFKLFDKIQEKDGNVDARDWLYEHLATLPATQALKLIMRPA